MKPDQTGGTVEVDSSTLEAAAGRRSCANESSVHERAVRCADGSTDDGAVVDKANGVEDGPGVPVAQHSTGIIIPEPKLCWDTDPSTQKTAGIHWDPPDIID